MGLSRSTFYDTTPVPLEGDGLVSRISAVCDEFECYGYRRVGAALRHEGVVLNGKKLRRLMREHDLQPRRRRRFVVTTDSNHGGPIFPDLAKDIVAELIETSFRNVAAPPTWLRQVTHHVEVENVNRSGVSKGPGLPKRSIVERLVNA